MEEEEEEEDDAIGNLRTGVNLLPFRGPRQSQASSHGPRPPLASIGDPNCSKERRKPSLVRGRSP